VSKTKVVRPLTSSFPLGEVTSLITPLQSEWIETHTKMLFCADMYPATVLFRMRALRENRCRGVAAVPAAGAITAAHCPAGNYGRRRCGVGGAGTCASARGVGGCDAASGPAATAAVSTTAPVGADAWDASGQVTFPAAPSPAPALRGNTAPQRGLRGAAATAPGSPRPASACWAATPRSGQGKFIPCLVPRWGWRRCSNPRRLRRRHCRRW